MYFSNSIRYGVRMVVYLAMIGSVCSSHDLAKATGVPRDYLVQIAQLLRKDGIITARPGKNGGYELAKDPGDITVHDVIRAVEGERDSSLDIESQIKPEEQTPEIRDMMDALLKASDTHDDYLDGITIRMILDGDYPT